MAKVSLRVYNRDIENLIDQGHLDEAIAHCRHILQSFPKHLETYRLLGKAYLEAKRYDEAVDVLQRVLMAVPDDFVSHVGMSIIRDDQGKLDDAIWHMERAFESQPSNAAIQGELRRLYGRRDGVEPPKIRMTRGALAHMYVQGELYPQAISEIKAVLGQDSQRVDMQVLLALAYFRSGQKADSSQIANQLLNRPGGEYGYESNRIMVELLQGSDAGDDLDVYKQRVTELDPYSAFTQGSVFQAGMVSDAAVTLERLEYSGQSQESAGAWSPGGISMTSPAAQPEWLSSAAAAAEEAPAPIANATEEIPEFLRQAGWSESTGTVDESVSPFAIEQTPPVSEADLAPSEMPDWLKAMSPATSAPVTPVESSAFGGVPAAGAPALSGEAEPADETPDWLRGLGGQPAASSEAAPATEETPDWLGGLGGGASASSTEAPITSEDTPTWLRSFRDDTPEPEAAAVEQPLEDSMPLNWTTTVDQSPSTVEPEPAAPVSNASLETLGASAQEQDDAVAWLESLAAKHGAKPEELVTDPNARSDTPPDWVEQARAIAESQPPAAPSAPLSAPAAAEPLEEEDRTGMWLRDLAEQENLAPAADQPALTEMPDLQIEQDVPSWLKNLEQADADQSQLPAEDTSLSAGAAEAPAASAWMAEPPAAAEQPAASAWMTEEPAAEQPAASAWMPDEPAADLLPSAADLPAWLQGLDQAQDTTAPAEEPASPETITEVADDSLPSWLKGDDDQSPAPILPPTTPADWRPVLPEAEPEAQAAEAPAAPKKATGPIRPQSEPVEAARAAPRARPIEPQEVDAALESAQAELNRGDIPAALEHYDRLIKRGRLMEEIIRDLREALYRYPVEVTVWQALGDAYMRANRLQEALDAYTKAEELLR